MAGKKWFYLIWVVINRFMSHSVFIPRVDMPTRGKLNLFWCSGSMAGVAMIIQLISGIICSVEYVKFVGSMFGFGQPVGEPGPIIDGLSLELLRFLHLWGARLLFVCLFVHMGRGIYYSRYSKNPIMWSLGVVLYVLIMAEAFLGYLLP
ncbi:unnamed protein product [Protopolystoma xenopodis]|uniref:Cytochrome b n=1 Tax=Protopolystoma xenopodis TaxID=117903 RepID=A0A448WFC5_9PLAT|nr:unnamed protein product [Protopolystoma xenopodis]